MKDALVYTEAFYGGRIPESQKQVAAIAVIRLVAIVKSDLRREFPDADDEMLDDGIRSVLNGLRVRGAGSPEVYYEKEGVAIGAFQQGADRMRELLSTQKELANTRAGEQDRTQRKATDRSVRDTVMDTFNAYQAEAVYAGHDTPALSAWKRIIDNDLDMILDLGNYAYFLINWQLLWENNLYDHEDVIRICQENPRLVNRKGPSFMPDTWRRLGKPKN